VGRLSVDLVSKLQALQFLRPVSKHQAVPSVTWGKPQTRLSQLTTKQAEAATSRAAVCPDTARRLRILVLAAGAVA